ncbi:MAG: hypothetical protein E7418_06045 [Ruminococcaceae bacterium]|nr:hypothetical protein [Oscillospiraceae bacterium]
MSKRVTALFAHIHEAEQAMHSLEGMGVEKEEISILTAQNVNWETTTENAHEGMISGGVIGATTGLIMGLGAFAVPGLGLLAAAGPVASLLTGAAAGGILGSLADMGVSDAITQSYMREIKKGNILLSVEVNEVYDAINLLKQAGAYQVDSAL